MKKIFKFGIVLMVVFFSIFTNASAVSAHLIGQPPFFKINGVYSNLYPVPTTSLNDFKLPQDLAAENYLVDQNLEMEIDKTQLPVAPEIVDQTAFTWDFGDGMQAKGLKNAHVYKKAGSYFMTVLASYQNEQPQLIQSVMIHILPDKNYKLPKAKILVNGKASKDPLTDIIKLDFSNEVSFSASQSESSGKIVFYRWDFGDGNSSTQDNPTHKYSLDAGQLFPVLRIKDENDFVSDAYIEIENGSEELNSTQNNTSESKPALFSISSLPLIAGVAIVIGLGSFMFLKKR